MQTTQRTDFARIIAVLSLYQHKKLMNTKNCHKLTLLILFLSILCTQCRSHSRALEKVSPARLVIYDNQYVRVLVGTPGKMYTLRLDRTCDHTLVLFSMPTSSSRSYIYYDGTNYGSELVYIGCNTLRLQVLFDPSFYKQDSSIPHNGVLCSGRGSGLWRHWTKATFSQDSLMLGEYDWSVVRTRYRPFEVHFAHGQYGYCSVEGRNYSLKYDPESEFTWLPHELYHSNRSIVMDFTEKHLLFSLTESDELTHLPTGFKHSAMKKQHRGNTEIILGQHSLGGTISHEDVVRRTLVVRPSFNMYSLGNSEPYIDSACALFLLGLVVFWLALCYTEDLGLKSVSLINSYVELLVLVSSSTITWMQHFGYNSSRFMNHHMAFYDQYQSLFTPYSLFLVIFVCSLAMFAVSLFLYWNTSKNISLRRSFGETALFMALWFSQLNKHGFYEHIILLSIVCFYTSIRLMEFLRVSTSPHPPKKEDLSTVLVGIWALFFSIYYNIIPFVRRFWYGFPYEYASVTNVFLLFIGLPVMASYLNLHLNWTKLQLLSVHTRIEEEKKKRQEKK